MAHMVTPLSAPSVYFDRTYPGTEEQFYDDVSASSTIYVGNLSFYTTEEQIHELFAVCGEIKRIIMGLDRNKKTPCGFCFVEYYDRSAALDCMKFINSTCLDERMIRTDLDPGYRPGRNLGRGRSGGQVRDEYREDYDAARGGWGRRHQQHLDHYADAQDDISRNKVVDNAYLGDIVSDPSATRFSEKNTTIPSHPEQTLDTSTKRSRRDDDDDDQDGYNDSRNDDDDDDNLRRKRR